MDMAGRGTAGQPFGEALAAEALNGYIDVEHALGARERARQAHGATHTTQHPAEALARLTLLYDRRLCRLGIAALRRVALSASGRGFRT